MDGGDGSEARGESLLLPLLQGLLGGGSEQLLAGLGAAPADVVADVRRSLGRLRAALAPPAHHPQARALLALADRLEDALDAADRLDGCRRRPRRRSRANRHTVGVTHEELEEARRLVDRDNLAAGIAEPPVSSAASTASVATDESRTPERKPSEGENVSYHAAVASRRKHPPPVTHSVSHETPKVSHEARVEVVERRAPAPRRPDFFRHSVAEAPQQPPAWSERRPSENKSSIAAIANKFDTNAQVERQQSACAPRRAPVLQPTQKSAPKEDLQRSFFRPLPPTYNFAAPPTTQDDSKPLNRFSSNGNKKLRMKRANTIDIGRPLAGYRDSDTEEEGSRHGPPVPEFRPQTESDRKFVAFMKKNEANEREAGTGTVGQANWSSRFGNIKHAFERSEREEAAVAGPRSSSASSSARRFWRVAEEAPAHRPRRFLDSSPEIIKPPWVTERRELARAPQPPRQVPPPRAPAVPVIPPAINYAPAQTYIPAPVLISPPYVPAPADMPAAAPLPASAPAPLPPPAAVPQTPTRPVVVKPFAARPIPVNQFSHAPMSAFKPPAKIPSPTVTPAYVWSPPSLSAAASPSAEYPPSFPSSPRPLTAGTPPGAPWQAPESDKQRQVVNVVTNDFQNKYEPVAPPPHRRPTAYEYPPPPPPTHAPPLTHNYPVKAIPSQNNLAAPELVRQVDEIKYPAEPPKVDAQKLQIEFYERQIREKNARRELPTAPCPVEPNTEPPAPSAYTITDYTPKSGASSTFVPLQRTPDIEKARAHKIDYLPDVVTNETDRARAPAGPRSPRPPAAPELPPAYRNGDAYTNGRHEESTTEHEVAVTRVMRGPVRGAATITAGVRTRGQPASGGAADALRGALDKVERRKREPLRTQVRAPVPNGRSPPPGPHLHPSPPSLGASRESVASSASVASAGSGLSRSGSWHQLAGGGKPSSPRRVVARAKSMHLLAIPKMYEGGIAREEVSEKQRTVEAYFAGSGVTPAAPAGRSPPRRSAHASHYALGRSRTMGALSELQFLDESNADDAFEDLVSGLA